MVKKLIISISFLLLCSHLYAQKNLAEVLSGKTESKTTIEFDRKKNGGFYVKHANHRKHKQLLFDFSYDDSISVYLNDSLIYSQWIRYSKKPTASYDVVPYFTVNKGKNYLTVILNKRKTFVRIRLRKKYYFVRVYYWDKDDKEEAMWSVTYSNNFPEED